MSLFIGFALIVSLIYSILLLGYSWIVEDNIFNRIVSDEAAYIQNSYKHNQTLEEPRAPFLTLYHEWSQLPQNIYRQHLKDPQQVEFKSLEGASIYVKPIELEGSTAVLVADISKFEVGKDYLPIVFISLIVLLLLVSGVALLVASFLAKKAIRPLKDLTNKVRNSEIITDGFAKDFPDNEIGVLAERIERSFIKIQTLLTREENFTRDVSHELRTPTTVLKNVLAELKLKPSLSDQQLFYLDVNINQIEQTIATLLALAREESANLEPLKLLDVIENSIIGHFELSNREDFSIELQVSEEFKVMANRNLLELLINNLLSNALQYSASKQLLIKTHGDTIIFENDTDYAHKQNPLDSQVKRETSDGLGLGLYLVKRVCKVLSWSVTSKVEFGRFILSLNIRK